MDIRNTRAMKTFAAERLSEAPQEKKIVLIYSSIVMGLALLSTLVHFVLGLQIDQMGGLSQIGTRTILSTVQSMLPLLQSLVVMCLELGYVAAMPRVARGQYASPNTLRLGFDRFWTLLRTKRTGYFRFVRSLHVFYHEPLGPTLYGAYGFRNGGNLPAESSGHPG